MSRAGSHRRIDVDHDKFRKHRRRFEEGLGRLKKLPVVQNSFGALDEGRAASCPVSSKPGLNGLFGFRFGGVVHEVSE